MELQLAPLLVKEIPEKYREALPPQMAAAGKDFFSRLPKEPSDDLPTAPELRNAFFRFTTRNLTSGTFEPENKCFENVVNKEDFWDEPDKMFNYSGLIAAEEVYGLLIKHSVAFLELLEAYISR